ncbi:MAG: phosphoenolpyruvate synthase, partial [Bacteroidetes bacterium]|nr:phosphoenolpyruvate synthase [Bacteroidota bacterium]
MDQYIRPFRDIRLTDVPIVGGKNASLGEMLSQLAARGIRVPDGFATTAAAFRQFLTANNITGALAGLLGNLDRKDFSNLADIGLQARTLVLGSTMPADLAENILAAYRQMSGATPGNASVAVRSSATAEDLPDASFAGQHESFLNISGEAALLGAVQRCFASLYTDRAIKYREDNHYPHENVALSVGIQKMVRADLACSGVGFTLEPESGFRDVIHISGVWGLGENIVQGQSTPDEFLIFKPTLQKGKYPILQKRLGEKEKTLVYADNGTANKDTPQQQREAYVLSDTELILLAQWALTIEEHYGRPMDIEWAKDGGTGLLYIVQARPETVQSRKNPYLAKEYSLLRKGECIATGQAVGEQIVAGRAKILDSPQNADDLQQGDIIVTDITSPDWDPLLKKAAAIVTNKGGRTSHASIVARELGVPAIVGAGSATSTISDGEPITVSCCEGKTGFVYRGKVEWIEKDIDLSRIKMPRRTKPMLITADPAKAFELSFYPNAGVGLLRMEFIITHHVRVHPMALVRFGTLTDEKVRQEIEQLTRGYPDKTRFFVDRLAEGIATIAAAFYPKDVILRTSDFKTNEYAHLIGGLNFEPKEENPMLGFRGASRYYNDLYKEGFRLECEAIRKVRNDMGLTNVKVMIPFCRTVEEGQRVIDEMKENGLQQHVNGLEVYVMAEIPANVLLADEFAAIFDGFSIGSNDLTQLTLGIDRDSSLVAPLFSEQNKAARKMIAAMISAARSSGAKIGLCGQAPSDFPEFARFLVEQGIDSISFNEDALVKGIDN